MTTTALLVLLAPACGGGSQGGADDIPPPRAAWIEDFRTGYFKDLSVDPIVDTQGRYTEPLVDKLEDCRGGKAELEALKRMVKEFEVQGGGPAVGDPPAKLTLHEFGEDDPRSFTIELDLVAAGAYELSSCDVSSE